MRDYEELVKELREKAERFDYDGWVETAIYLEKIADAIEELVAAVPKWISVEEPPKENGRYLVRYKRDVDLGDETVHEDDLRIMRFFTGEGWRYPLICSDNVRLLNEEVTHWMPLPEPPKELP